MLPDDEEQLRQLQAMVEGVDPKASVTFLDTKYEVATRARLAPLLRYAALGQPTARERARLECMGDALGGEDEGLPNEQSSLSAAHCLLEDTVLDFRAFSEAALAGKAMAKDVHSAVERIIEVNTARPALAGLRLLRHVAGNLSDLDGRLLLAGGQGIRALSVRETCNACYVYLYDRVDDERKAEWVESLYLDYSPEDRALEMVRRMQADRRRKQEEAGGEVMGDD